MNLTPAEIALRNLVANQFGIDNLAIVDGIVRSADGGPTAKLTELVDKMLVGPAGDLTGKLEATAPDADDCHCTLGYVAALRDITEAKVVPSPLLNDDQKYGFMEGFTSLQQVAGQIADEVEASGELPPKYDDAEDAEGDPSMAELGAVLAAIFGGVAPPR